MRANFLLTSSDPKTAETWARQLPWAPVPVANAAELRRELQNFGSRVWIRDLRDRVETRVHPDTVVIAVGDPQTPAFELASDSQEFSFCLSYAEAATNLNGIARLASELADSRATLSVMQERRQDRGRETPPPPPSPESAPRWEELEFIEAAIANLGYGDRVIEEFKRAVRTRLQAQRVVIFVRTPPHGYVASPEGLSCPADGPFASWFEQYGAAIDSNHSHHFAPPEVESSIRGELQRWNARLVIPVNAAGTLEGWIALGPRGDGRPYAGRDIEDALRLARLFAAMLRQRDEIASTRHSLRQIRLLQKYGPKFAIVDSAGVADADLPVEAREIASNVRRKARAMERDFGRIRVSAGPIPETGGVWVAWEYRDPATDPQIAEREKERYSILHDLGIILSHELGNGLFSVSTFCQAQIKATTQTEENAAHRAQVKKDLDRLKSLPQILNALHEMSSLETESFDLGDLISSVAKKAHADMDIADGQYPIVGHRKYLNDALLWLVGEIEENRDTVQSGNLKFTLRKRDGDGDPLYLISLSHPGLRMEHLRVGDARTVAEYPTVPVFLSREVIRWHHGSIQLGQGGSSPELRIALRSRPSAPPGEAAAAEPIVPRPQFSGKLSA